MAVAVPLPEPETFEPTDGVVFALRLIPNWLVPCDEAPFEDIAAIVLAPEVSVLPVTVIE